ncbi:DUF7532 family protein [Halosegnis marinus]|uniref:SnoaL-like domain-containing protein n=1 Tax=Halosegnis marinus TaxID=3034023 RepID=A0ABD5ZMW6_9EURY|nr:hypothetical protein [Halosegnis sp. DT85]
MHFDQREQAALREVGLDTDDLRRASEGVTARVADAADDLEAFFDAGETFYSDMDLAHAGDGPAEHAVEHLDTYTHAADLRGWLRFETWGVAVTDGRVLDDDLVELTLDGRHGRVRFAADPEAL